MIEFPMQLVVPIGAALAAAITATASFVSLMVSKEQKISEFRQAWIDSLRSELAEFSSNARRISSEEHPINLKAIGGTFIDSIEANNEEIMRPDQFHENRLCMAQAYYAIRLRLNPDENDHTSILQGMDEVYTVLANTNGTIRFSKTVEALDNLAIQTQRGLKREWLRVKEGEPGYRRVVKTVKFIGIILALILSVLVLYSAASTI
jgi:hypothetical protein